MALYVVLTVMAITVLGPTVRRQIELAERGAAGQGNESLESELAQVNAKVRSIGVTAGLLVIGIVFFMVVKPALWSAG